MGNANSGRRPAPAAIAILRGNPGKRRVNLREPAIAPADPSFDRPPRQLAGDPVARAEWRRVAPRLRVAGLVSETERSALTALCQQWSRYLEAHGQIRDRGIVLETAKGPIPSPYLAVADRALAHCHRLWAELGLTPSGRTRAAKLPAPLEAPAPSKWAGLL
jgi:P27 family predicted phage terminase small subunit